MVASPAKEHRDTNTVDTGLRAFPAALRTAVIYGPNAAGKSNLVKALAFMKQFVISSAKDVQEGDEIDVEPFRFDELSPTEPSEFEAIFVENHVRYHYGFTVNRERVLSEWLIAYPSRSPQIWISREYDVGAGKYFWGKAPSLKGKKSIWQDSTRDNALFLSTAVQLNSDQLKPVFSWFRSRLRIIEDAVTPVYTASQCKDLDKKASILNLLRTADISISDIEIEDKEITPDLVGGLSPALASELMKSLEGKKFSSIEFVHEVDGRRFKLSSEDESDGTNKLFALAGPWLDVLSNGRVIVMDELHNSLHPVMVKFLVQLFHDPAINKSGAQLVMTTHDTTIMDKDILRRDQIWFVEKDQAKCSRVYSLTEFSPRNKEALERGYLQGRYGAIPYIGELRV